MRNHSRIAARKIQNIFDSQTTYPAFKWNEGLSRAGRHFLNDQASCGSTGDIYSMGFSQILSAYYVWNVLDLNY